MGTRSRKVTIEDLKSLEGKTFGRLTVLSYEYSESITTNSSGGFDDYYKCQCNCEDHTILIVKRHDLLRGHKLSCGCLQRENAKYGLASYIAKHGLKAKNPRLYNIWKGMKQRCSNKNNPSYPNYGGRGIGVDWSWFYYPTFYNNMHEEYEEHCKQYGENNTSLERKDVNDMYCKENCTWATNKEQANNTRKTRKVEYNNNVYTLSDLLDNFPHHESVDVQLLYHRIINGNWDIEKALIIPKK